MLIGYSGHALVVFDILVSMGRRVVGYCEKTPQISDPHGLPFLGLETEPLASSYLEDCDYFVCLGDNALRESIQVVLTGRYGPPLNAIHSSAQVSTSALIGQGVMLGPLACVNSCARLADGVILNTRSTVEHECVVDEFVHVAPGATLAGNVKVGRRTLIGSQAVVVPGVVIGEDVLVGAGTVVIRNIAAGSKVVGNPARACRKIP